MQITLLRDYRGWITNERFYKAGDHDIPQIVADVLIKNGRAVVNEFIVPDGFPDAPHPSPQPIGSLEVAPPPDLSPGRKVVAYKNVKALAAKHNLLLYSVVGTGKNGRITLEDVQALIVEG